MGHPASSAGCRVSRAWRTTVAHQVGRVGQGPAGGRAWMRSRSSRSPQPVLAAHTRGAKLRHNCYIPCAQPPNPRCQLTNLRTNYRFFSDSIPTSSIRPFLLGALRQDTHLDKRLIVFRHELYPEVPDFPLRYFLLFPRTIRLLCI